MNDETAQALRDAIDDRHASTTDRWNDMIAAWNAVDEVRKHANESRKPSHAGQEVRDTITGTRQGTSWQSRLDIR